MASAQITRVAEERGVNVVRLNLTADLEVKTRDGVR
jgi:hypothetical protein